MADLSTQIESAAQEPKKASGDQGSMEAHPLPDLIEADKYLAGKQAASVTGFGLRIGKIEAGGAV